MAALALVLIAVWLLVAAGVRTAIHVRSTGAADVVRFRDRPGSVQWWTRLLSTLGFACTVAAPVAELLGMAPIPVLDRPAVRVAGVVIVVLGIGITFAAQLAMGASWRADVDPDARTSLITTGPFRLVRNPVLTATAATFVGVVLMVPNPLAVTALVVSLTAIELQVRLVEEPYLRRVHHGAYARYAATTGRFLPWLGRARTG